MGLQAQDVTKPQWGIREAFEATLEGLELYKMVDIETRSRDSASNLVLKMSQ